MRQRRDTPARRERPSSWQKPQQRTPTERVVYGVHPVLEALRARASEVERVFLLEGGLASGGAREVAARAEAAGIRIERLAKERLLELAYGGVHQGVVAQLRAYAYAELPDLLARAQAAREAPLVVVLDGIQDPSNLGAILRSAYAFGAHGVVVGRDRAAAVTPAVAKASAGAVEHIPVARVTNISRSLEELKAAGLWVAAADPRGDTSLWDARLGGPLALVVGGEGVGIRPGVLGHTDFRLRIPIGPRIASLNASVAAALLLYEVARQRAHTKSGA